jgi:predicted AAA+ superfamily ATPase
MEGGGSEMENLLEPFKVLEEMNPWWRTGGVPTAFLAGFRRDAFYQTWNLLRTEEARPATLLVGPRRVGKTTVLYQLIDALLREGIAGRSILYASFDHPILKVLSPGEVLEFYETAVKPLPEEPQMIQGFGTHARPWIFLDEIQYAQDWDRWLKVWVDQKKDRRIVATGSSASLLKKGARESGLGRWSELKIFPMTFAEFCLLRKHSGFVPEWVAASVQNPQQIGEALQQLLKTKLPQQIVAEVGITNIVFNDYLLRGGFPEGATAPDPEKAQRMLREDVLDRILYKDLGSVFLRGSSTDLERLFLYVANNTGGLLDTTLLSRVLGISRATVHRYLQLLEDGGLIGALGNFSSGGKKALKSQKKAFVIDTGLRNAVLMRSLISRLSPEETGRVVESVVFTHLLQLSAQWGGRIFYWRDRKHEVDFVVPMGDRLFAMEVSWSRSGEVSKALKRFTAQNEGVIPWTVSRDLSNEEGRMNLFVFCLWMGYMLRKDRGGDLNPA